MYDGGMADESLVRKLSPEFWAIIGAGVTLLVAIVGIAALILTVAGWIREDMQAMDARIGHLDAKLSAEIRALDTKLSAEIRVLDAKLSAEIRALDAKLSDKISALDAKLSGEISALDSKLSGEMREIDGKVAVIDKRLAVVESHVLDARRIVHAEPAENT